MTGLPSIMSGASRTLLVSRAHEGRQTTKPVKL